MKKNISRNPLWPDWYNGKKIDEVQFGRAFLEQWPLKCVNGTLYTLDGPVEDESEIKQRILENIEEYVTSGLSKKVTIAQGCGKRQKPPDASGTLPRPRQNILRSFYQYRSGEYSALQLPLFRRNDLARKSVV